QHVRLSPIDILTPGTWSCDPARPFFLIVRLRPPGWPPFPFPTKSPSSLGALADRMRRGVPENRFLLKTGVKRHAPIPKSIKSASPAPKSMVWTAVGTSRPRQTLALRASHVPTPLAHPLRAFVIAFLVAGLHASVVS